jgi:hypothetical protein
MEVLFVFLKWVASFAHMDETTGSKMDLGNLATVICPSILYSRGRDAVRDESFGAIRVVTFLLEHQDEFNTVPEEFLSILHDQDYFSSSIDLSSKEIMKKCDTYMRLKSNGRPQPLNNANNDPRFPPPNSANFERPLATFSSERPIRPFQHPTLPPNASFSVPNSPALSMPTTQSPYSSRPAMDERPTTPRAINSGVPSSRPTSYVQPRPSGEYSQSLPPNGYQTQAAVRQRS